MLHPFVLSCFSRGRLFVTLWIVARLAPLSMEFSREQYWSGLPWPSPGNFPNPGIKPTLCLLCLRALVGDFFITSTTWEDCHNATLSKCQCMLYNISFKFWHFHYDMSWCRSAWDYLVWDPLFFLYLDICCLLQVWELHGHNFIGYSLDCFFSLFFWDSSEMNVGILSVVSKVPETIPMFLVPFSFCCSDWVTSNTLIANHL